VKKISHYHHVCNGGPTLSVYLREDREDVDRDVSRIELKEGYEGTSMTKWAFYNPSTELLRKWADVLLEAAREIENQTPEQFE